MDSSFKLAMELFHHPVCSGMVTCGVGVLNSEQSQLASTVSGDFGVKYSPRNEGSGNQFFGNIHKKNGFRPSGESDYAGQDKNKFGTDWPRTNKIDVYVIEPSVQKLKMHKGCSHVAMYFGMLIW